MSEIKKYLQDLFKKERIVFWYDEKEEFKEDLQTLDLENVTVVEVQNNEFGVKRRIIREEPNGKFLLYFSHAKPENQDNWLLDLLLANGEFHTDRSSVILQELGLSQEFKYLVEKYLPFFRSSKRQKDLKNILTDSETEKSLQYKMLAVLCNCQETLDDILLVLVTDLALKDEGRYKQIVDINLDTFLWRQIETSLGYKTDKPSIRDFVFYLFTTVYDSILGERSFINNNTLVFMNRWKDSSKYQHSFKVLSSDVARKLKIEEELEKTGYQDLLELDIFEQADKIICSGLVKDLLEGSITFDQVSEVVEARENTLWFEQYNTFYMTVFYGSEFLDNLSKMDLSFSAAKEGFDKYLSTYFRQDMLYRKFIHCYQSTGAHAHLQKLYNKVENHYSNSFLLPLNDRWQQYVNSMDKWCVGGKISQREFFNWYVNRFITQKKKIFVIISDALRYETAVEFRDRLLKMDRYDAELESLLGVLPSYTKLGMASLLPHQKLGFGNDFSTVFADGKSTQGLSNRKELLSLKLPGKATAIRAEEFLNMNTMEEGRELSRNNEVIYIYHNGIDKTGDTRETESAVFEAVEKEFEILLKLIKKIANVNGNNIIITSDHGFIYQDKPLEESDFASYEVPEGARDFNRRFVIGEKLSEQPAFKHFKASQLGLEGSGEVLIPKSINRLRVHGAGSRYVHGGSSLQEIVIPVLLINKKRTSNIQKVEVNVLNSSRITSRQPVISLYQKVPVGDKVLPRELRMGFYSSEGNLISDVKYASFGSTKEDGRSREKKITFTLTSDADKSASKEVVFKMEEQVSPEVNQFTTYREYKFMLSLFMGADFEEF
jgi:uncharacterized protein (TIGR02687 family)